jgi:PPOX class probable F420-dependent enzyme
MRRDTLRARSPCCAPGTLVGDEMGGGMPYNAMTAEECYAFCTSPVRPAIVSTVRANGRPHAAPIWYALDGRDFLFTTGRETVKGRNLLRDPRLALCIQDDQPPFAYVRVEGAVDLEDDLHSVRTWAERIGGRYMGADRAQEYGARNGVVGELLVRVRVTHIAGVKDVAL